MSVYFIAVYDITDPAGYEGYVPGVIPLLQKHNCEILVADYDATTLEGDKRQTHVVLRFPDETTAKAWYEDPDYQPLLKQRLGATSNGYAAFTKAFVPPSE